MSDQNPARDYDKESLEYMLTRLQEGLFVPLTIQEIETELKRRADLPKVDYSKAISEE
jgi:hypothetical protein